MCIRDRKKLRRKARYLALWCGAPVAAAALAAARRAAVSAADAAEMDPPEADDDGAADLARLADVRLDDGDGAPRPPVVVAAPPAVDYDEPD